MEEIDQMLNQWIYNSIIRAKLRKLIVNAIHKYSRNSNNKYKLNTNTNG